WDEWKKGESNEARLAFDADQLDMILELRHLEFAGNSQATDWLFYAQKRLKTKEGQKLAANIMAADPNRWWFERNEAYWVLNSETMA
ncbi:MAG: HD domain-containing protein, partial [Candidatus Adiutrix sp.]